jgi:hypothetical protein
VFARPAPVLVRVVALSLFTALCAATTAPVVSAAPIRVTAVTMTSDQGDYIGQGLSRLFHPGNGSVTLSGNSSYLTVSVSGGTNDDYFTFELAAPPGETLAVGHYPRTQAAAVREPGRPGLEVKGSGRGCNAVVGRFTVHEITTAGTSVSSFWATYEQHCEGGTAGLYGEIRYEQPSESDLLVAPLLSSWAERYPGTSSGPMPVTVVNTGSAPVTVGDPQLVGEQRAAFMVDANTCTSSVPVGGSCAVQLRFTPTAPGPHRAQLLLDTSSSAGRYVIELSGEGVAGTTAWRMTGESGDFVYGGRSADWNPGNANLAVRGSDAGLAMRVESFDGQRYDARLHPGDGDVLQPGRRYSGARRYGFADGAPGLEVDTILGRCKTISGEFTIHELQVEDGVIALFSATFEQHCDGAQPALRGSLAYRAANGVPPTPGPQPADSPAGAQPRATDDSCPDGRVPEDGFTDVAPASQHERSIDCVVWWEVARGRTSTEYGPSLDVTRAQMATFIASAITRSGGALQGDPPNRFSDDNGSPHERSIDRLAHAGIVAGLADGRYGPDQHISRAQMATFLVRAYEYVSGRALPAGGDSFSDDDGTPHEANIDKIARAGFTGGAEHGAYRPGVSVKRDQMASFIARMLDLLVEEGGARTP